MFGLGKEIDIKNIISQVKNDEAYLVDVRENEEWDRLHAKDALHLSVNRILNGEVPTMNKSKKLYLYCESGARASMATMKLKADGYWAENIGGLAAWDDAGGPTESGM